MTYSIQQIIHDTSIQYVHVNQNTYNSKHYHPPPPYLIEMISYASYISKRLSCVDLKGEVIGSEMTGMAQLVRSSHHQWGKTSPSPPNEHHEEETKQCTSSVAGFTILHTLYTRLPSLPPICHINRNLAVLQSCPVYLHQIQKVNSYSNNRNIEKPIQKLYLTRRWLVICTSLKMQSLNALECGLFIIYTCNPIRRFNNRWTFLTSWKPMHCP